MLIEQKKKCKSKFSFLQAKHVLRSVNAYQVTVQTCVNLVFDSNPISSQNRKSLTREECDNFYRQSHEGHQQISQSFLQSNFSAPALTSFQLFECYISVRSSGLISRPEQTAGENEGYENKRRACEHAICKHSRSVLITPLHLIEIYFACQPLYY